MSSRAQTNVALIACLLPLCAALGQTSKPPANSNSPLAQAKVQLAKHNLKAAEDSIWQVLSSHPDDADALLLLGVVRAEQQRYPEAETLFERVVQLEPQSAAAHLNLGKTLVAENKLPEATEQYKQAEQLAPQNVEVEVTLARLYATSGECSLAMTSLDRIPAAHFPAEAVPAKVGCLLALGHQDDAMKLAQGAGSPAVQLALAEVFLASKLPQESLKLLDAAAASGKRPPARFYLVKGEALDATGDSTAALENFQKALALEPESEDVLLTTAEIYARQSKHAEAFELLQKAHKLDPDSPRVLRPLILEASFAGKSASVQDAAEHLAKSDEPQDIYVAASVFLKTGRQAEALPLLEKYVAKVPDDARAWTGLGVAYAEQKRLDDAQKAFEHAVQADPKFFDAEYQMGLLAGLNNNSADATKHFERAVEINPDHAPSLEKLGNIYLESGQFEKARDALTRAEGLDPRNRQVEYGLALAYSKLGNREEAKIHMERFEKAGPIGSTEIK